MQKLIRIREEALEKRRQTQEKLIFNQYEK